MQPDPGRPSRCFGFFCRVTDSQWSVITGVPMKCTDSLYGTNMFLAAMEDSQDNSKNKQEYALATLQTVVRNLYLKDV